MIPASRAARPRVLVCGHLEGRALEILEERGCEVDHRASGLSGSLAGVIGPYQGVIVHSAQLVDAATLAAGKDLRVVGRAGVGVDNIDIEAATRAGVLVMNLPWGNTVTAAEHTIALLMALARNIPQAAAALRGGVWERAPYLGSELEGKVLGVVGFGRIGREVARRAQALEMQVLASDPHVSPAVAADLGIEMMALEELLPRVDILTLHLPISEETHHLVDAAALDRLKSGAYLVNCARGGIVDEVALRDALERGHLAGAACDVFEDEPEPNLDLLSLPNFIGTPHIGGATREAREKVGEGIARQVAEFLTEGIIAHALNVQALPPEEQRPMIPYLDLGARMGSLLAQCFSGIEALRIEYLGELVAYTLKPVSTNIVVGFLGAHLGDEVNMVNAWSLARERGLDVQELTGGAPRGYSSLVRVVGRAGGVQHSIAGVVFDEWRPRVVELEGLAIELMPAGHLLLFANDDRPGVVGAVGDFLGAREVNIAEVRLGRDQSGGEAIAALTLDSPLDEDTLAEFVGLESIRWARMVSFDKLAPREPAGCRHG